MKKTFKVNIYVPNSKDPLFSDPIQKEIVAELEDKSFLVDGKKVWKVSHPWSLCGSSKWYKDCMYLNPYSDVKTSLKFRKEELTHFFEELLLEGEEIWVGETKMGESSQKAIETYWSLMS
ncbi:MAG: hypothetical protein PHX25_01490 [Candidatus Pacebacteria bacterium]|nr:hypothetical protein [Candidatus Paceibacterota bacterium]